MNSKKILWQTIGLILVTLLVGCSSVHNEPTATPTTVPPTATPTPIPPTATPRSPKVLIVIRSYSSADMSYMTDNELGVMIDMLEDAGYEIRIASHYNRPYESETRTITPDLLVGDVDMTDFDAVIMPCLAAGKTLASQEIIDLVTEFYKQEKVIAAQYGARVTLYEQDIITIDQLSSSEVLQNGSVITSGCCPYMAKNAGCEDGTRALIEKLITTLTK